MPAASKASLCPRLKSVTWKIWTPELASTPAKYLSQTLHRCTILIAALLHIHSDLFQEAVDAFTIIAHVDVVGAPAGSLGYRHNLRVERIIRLPTAVDWDSGFGRMRRRETIARCPRL